jgi:methionyl-tRNA formyltransferase|tara:strand:+ start:219 stop:899 length:681 start_codon:yes stop_codon:yes gene_type:complete
MKNKILFCGYRDWALKVYDFIKSKYESKIDITLVKSEKEFNDIIDKLTPNLIFFVGWSWIVNKDIVNKFKSICLHPSPLPKYRGGSPLQHQIISGEKESAVTLFIMNEQVDKGPILWQEEFSLDGDLTEIFDRIIEKGKKGLNEVIDIYLKQGNLKGTLQDENKATYYKRRTPEQSEIKISDFDKYTAEELNNKIRALQDPYPNAFIICKDRTKLFIQKSKIKEEK